MRARTIAFVVGTAFALLAAEPSAGASSSPRTTVVRPLAGAGPDFGVSITPLASGAIVSGYTSTASGDLALLLRIDRDGEIVWRRTLAAGGDGALWAVHPAGDGTFVGVGWAKGDDGGLDALAARFDTLGTVLWQRVYHGPSQERLWSVDATPRGLIAAGEAMAVDGTSSRALVLRFGLDGAETGRALHGGAPVERVFAVCEETDGGYVLAGTSGAGPRESPGYDARIARYDARDRQTWSRAWGGAGFDVAHDAERRADGGLIVTGYTYADSVNRSDAFLLALSSGGEVQWSRRYGGRAEDRATHVAALADGGLATIGYSHDPATGGWDVVIRASESDGAPRWERRFGGRVQELGRALATTTDGALVAVGHSRSYGPAERILYVRLEDLAGPGGGESTSPLTSSSAAAPRRTGR